MNGLLRINHEGKIVVVQYNPQPITDVTPK